MDLRTKKKQAPLGKKRHPNTMKYTYQYKKSEVNSNHTTKKNADDDQKNSQQEQDFHQIQHQIKTLQKHRRWHTHPHATRRITPQTDN